MWRVNGMGRAGPPLPVLGIKSTGVGELAWALGSPPL